MEELTLTLIYWYASVGLFVGLIFGIVIEREGVSLEANIFWGLVGGIIMGIIGLDRGIGDGVFFSFFTNLAFLFLINVFHQHHVEDILGEIEHPAHIHQSRRKTRKKTGFFRK